MTKFLKYLMFLLVAVAVASCGDDDKKGDDGDEPVSGRPLTGTWVCIQAESTSDIGFTYIFNKNGSGQAFYNENSRHDKFSDYVVEKGILKIMWEGDGAYDEKGPITISGDTFTIDMYGDDLMVFKKQ